MKSGTVVTTYLYDAWGNHLHTTGSLSATVGRYNPLRYRGYVYDRETKLYYLQSRYYNPETGRFINGDGFTTTGQGIIGNNMFAYCGNNPVVLVDKYGYTPWWSYLFDALVDPVGGLADQVTVSSISYTGMAIFAIWDKDVRDDMNAIGWNPFNSDATETVKSEKVSFYKGAPVFRYDNNRSGSFYGILLKRQADENELQHERGHNDQAIMMGTMDYLSMIVAPSAGNWSSRTYYARPWEITADLFGDVNRTHSQADIMRGFTYLWTSALTGGWGYLFLPGEY